jgi:putative ABC transport system ATP-binding protein
MSVTEMRAEGMTVLGGDTILIRDLELHIRGGQITGITGTSGSGKTTLLYALGGLIPAAKGRLLVDGRPATPWRELATGLIFQNLCLVPMLSAEETVALPLQARGIDRSEVSERSLAALAALGLADHHAQLVKHLSGGQRQRVAVARALAGRPDVILADEPTSALDEHWRTVVLSELGAQAARGAVVILASGDEGVAARCDQVLELEPALAH